MLGSHLTPKDKILRIPPPKPFEILEEALQVIPEARALETVTFASDKTPLFSTERTKEAIAEPVRPEWSG
ncbi:MAG: hypothetical protein WEC84_02585 [Candidatus Andersenbacteria bacterium]